MEDWEKEAGWDLGRLASFRVDLINWFLAEGRDYPWRRTRDPYAILVSEAMLQQTQVATVLERGYYRRWMERFPTWEALAAAGEPEILKAWEGLGYYNRARHLHRAARQVCEVHGGRLPGEPLAIRSLPGVGPYTAGALLSFAFEQRAPLVDGNVARVLARLFALDKAIDSSAGLSWLWARAEVLVPEDRPRLFNSAIMELGQRICRPTRPDCPTCPVRAYCRARALGETGSYPVKGRGLVVETREERVVLAERGGRVYLCPESGTRRRGLWRLPEVGPEQGADCEELFRFDYPITRYRVTLRVLRPPAAWEPSGDGGRWFPRRAEQLWPPLGAPYRRALVWEGGEADGAGKGATESAGPGPRRNKEKK